MKKLRQLLLKSIFWEHILPFLFLNGCTLFLLPFIFTKGFEEGYSLIVIWVGAILAVILVNFHYLIIHLILWAYISAIEVTPKAMYQILNERQAIVSEIHVSSTIQTLALEKPTTFTTFTKPRNQEKKVGFFPPLQINPLSNLPYELFSFTSILRP